MEEEKLVFEIIAFEKQFSEQAKEFGNGSIVAGYGQLSEVKFETVP